MVNVAVLVATRVNADGHRGVLGVQITSAEAGAGGLAFTAFPKEIWRQIWSNNPSERLNREIRRGTDVVGIVPDRNSNIPLVGAVLTEQHDEGAEARRYLGLEALAKARLTMTTTTEEKPAAAPITALSA